MNKQINTVVLGGPFPSKEIAEKCFNELNSFHAASKAFVSESPKAPGQYVICYQPREGEQIYSQLQILSVNAMQYCVEFWLNGYNTANKIAEEKIAKEKADKEETKAKKDMAKIIKFAEELKYQLALTGKVGYFDIWGKYANEDSALSGFLQGHSFAEIYAACNYLKEKGFIHASVYLDEIEVNAFNCK